MSMHFLQLAAACYAVAAVGYLTFLARPKLAKAAGVGTAALSAAFVIHAAAIAMRCAEVGGREFFTVRGGFMLLAWLGGGAYLALHRIYRIPVVGAFVGPLVLFTMIPALFGVPGVAAQAAVLHSEWLPVHVTTAFLGIALFTLASGVALMYVLQEREVKGKRFGALFSRLPSLEQLDEMNQRLVRWGFIVFSVALVTGALFARQAWGSFWAWDPKQVFSLVTWLLYAAIVQLRWSAGWHGRRAAVMTIVGFVLVLGSFVGTNLLPFGRHGGDFQ